MTTNFQKFLTRKYSVLMDDMIVHAWLDDKRFFKLTGVKEFVKDIEIIDGAFCFDMNWMDKIIKVYKDKEFSFFWDFSRNGYKYGETIRNFSRKIKLKTDIENLKKEFWEGIELLNNLLVFVPQTHSLAKIIEIKVRYILTKKGFSRKELEEVLLSVTQPKKKNTPVLEQIDLKKIKNKLNDSDFNIDEALKKHFEKYSFLGYREPFSKGFDIDFFKKMLMDNPPAEKKLKELKPSFNKEEQKWVGLMQEFVYFRNYRTEKMIEAFFYFEPLWNEIGRHYSLEENELAEYQITEVKRLFESGTKVKKGAIADREKGHGYLVHDGRVKLIIGEELEEKIAYYDSYDDSIREIRGSIACDGKIRGLVKVVLSSGDQSKVKDGEVLITSMTTPDYLPSMRRAAAFVTDEGGITCHAAIVAREMNKPCIIGAKIATKVFKDGDLVEVDAENGIVKKLK